MTRVSNTDQILLLLRAQLQRAERQRRKQTGRAALRRTGGLRPLQRLKALAKERNLSEAELSRGVLAALLAENLGEDLVNESRFHGLVERVWKQVQDDAEVSALLRACLTSLRS